MTNLLRLSSGESGLYLITLCGANNDNVYARYNTAVRCMLHSFITNVRAIMQIRGRKTLPPFPPCFARTGRAVGLAWLTDIVYQLPGAGGVGAVKQMNETLRCRTTPWGVPVLSGFSDPSRKAGPYVELFFQWNTVIHIYIYMYINRHLHLCTKTNVNPISPGLTSNDVQP